MDTNSSYSRIIGFRFGFPLAIFFALCFATHSAAGEGRWDELKTTYFGDRDIAVGDGVIELQAPPRAHDAATVPIVITPVDPDHRIRRVHLIVDKNPLPLAGIFNLSEAAGSWQSLETRIRINEYTDVRAIAELEDGSLYMTSRFVKASGGCSAPAMSDMDVAMARAGKMQLMLDNFSPGNSSPAEAVIKISHPNNSGMQFDQISRNYIPAFYVHKIAAELNGEQLIDVETNFSLSENPVVYLNFKPRSGSAKSSSPPEIRVYAEDSKGNRYQKSLALE